MKKEKKQFLKTLQISSLLALSIFLISSDHMDTPSVTGEPSDATDFYAFEGKDPRNLVFAIAIQGMMSPEATKSARFDENVLIEINIDNDNDHVEDLVIQAIPKGDLMYFFGPVAPSRTGSRSVIEKNGLISKVKISTLQSTKITKNRGIKFFAGPRDDPFFFDAGQFIAIATGQATSFNDPGVDTFAGTNALGIVVEVPKYFLGRTETLNTWIETKVLE